MYLNIVKANARIKELENEHAEFIKALKQKDEVFEQFKSDVEQAATDKVELAQQIETLKAEHAKAIESLNLEVEAAKASANRQAAEVVASMGVAADTIKPISQETLTPEQIMAKFEALKSDKKALSEFYNKHRATILRAQGL